jgi:glycerol-3-phosphate dehydrogenase (NAD(P)+)
MGAGLWGTTFAQVLCDAGTRTELWARRAELTEAINASHENPSHLPGIQLSPGLHATADAAEALAGADLVVLAVPAQTLRRTSSPGSRCCPPSRH